MYLNRKQARRRCMEEFLKVMKALSAPNRVKIIKLLQHEDLLCVCEIQDLLGISESSVSTHLRILHEAGMVERHKKNLWVHYRLSGEPGSPYAATILMNMKTWLNASAGEKELLGKIPEVREKDLCSSLPRSRRGSRTKSCS